MNKIISFCIVSLTLSFYTVSIQAQNPISPAGVYIADPTGRIGMDGKMYIYGSLDDKTSDYCSTLYHVISSPDLLDWTLHKNTFSSKGEGDEVPYSDLPMAAPDMLYRNGIYHLYYDLADGTEGVAISEKPEGPFRNGVLIDGAMGIDPTVFIDDDGQAYYYWGQFSAKGAKMNPDMKTIDKSSIVDGIVTEQEHFFHEGGFIFKRNGFYYFIYTDISRQDRATCIGYAMSKSPLGPYEYKGVIIDNAGCDPEVWNNHGSVVEYKGQWYVLYHRSTHHSKSMRKACIEPITFRPDGTIPEVQMTSQGAGKPLDAFQQIDASRACLVWGDTHIRLMDENSNREKLSGIYNEGAAAWKYLDFGKGVKKFTVRLKSQAGGIINIASDEPWHPAMGQLRVPANSDWVTLSCDVKSVSGVHALWLGFWGESGKELFEVDWFSFE